MDSSTGNRQNPFPKAAARPGLPRETPPSQAARVQAHKPAPAPEALPENRVRHKKGARTVQRAKAHRRLWTLALTLLFGAAFLLGAGCMQLLLKAQQEARRMPTVLEDEQVGKVLDASLSNVSVADEMLADASGRCRARIENKPENGNSARVQIVRSATGEVLYESGLIDPGYYVEYINLNIELREGWYPCRVVWEFYDPATLRPAGKASQSAVLIVRDT